MSIEINFVDNAAAPTESHYVYLLGLLYDNVLSYPAFLSVVAQVSRNLSSPISREKTEEICAALLLQADAQGKLTGPHSSSWEEDILRLSASDIRFLQNQAQTLANSLAKPWLFLGTGTALARWLSTSPQDVLPVIRGLTYARSRARKQAAASALRQSYSCPLPYTVIDDLLPLTTVLLDDPSSEDLRKLARAGAFVLLEHLPRKILICINTWSTAGSWRLRQTAALLLGDLKILDETAGTLLSLLQSDSDDRVNAAAKNSIRIRNAARTESGRIESELLRAWQTIDPAEHQYQLSLVFGSYPSSAVLSIARHSIFSAFVLRGDFEGFSDAIDRFTLSYGSKGNLVLALAPLLNEAWEKSPGSTVDMLAKWYLDGRASQLLVQWTRNRGKNSAELLAQMLIRALEISPSHVFRENILETLGSMIHGKSRSAARYKTRLRNNTVQIMVKLYEYHREAVEDHLQKWLRSEDNYVLSIAVETLVQLGREGSLGALSYFFVACENQDPGQTKSLFRSLMRTGTDKFLRRYVVTILLTFILEKPEFREEANATLHELERILNRSDLTCLPQIIEELPLNIDSPLVQLEVLWTHSELLRLLVLAATGNAHASTMFSIYSKHWKLFDVTRDPDVKFMFQSYSSALLDPADEFIYLYEIRDRLSRIFGGKSHACAKLSISKSDWERLGFLANAAPVFQGRHRGSVHGELRAATKEEIDFARNATLLMIGAFNNHLGDSCESRLD